MKFIRTARQNLKVGDIVEVYWDKEIYPESIEGQTFHAICKIIYIFNDNYDDVDEPEPRVRVEVIKILANHNNRVFCNVGGTTRIRRRFIRRKVSLNEV